MFASCRAAKEARACLERLGCLAIDKEDKAKKGGATGNGEGEDAADEGGGEGEGGEGEGAEEKKALSEEMGLSTAQVADYLKAVDRSVSCPVKFFVFPPLSASQLTLALMCVSSVQY